MNNGSLRFGLNFDRDYTMDIVRRIQLAYGVLVSFTLHPAVFYLLFVHTKNMSRALQIGYILNQTQLFLHDVWMCFFFQAYFLLPYPIMHCSGLLCSVTNINANWTLIIEAVFMVNALSILLALLLIMNQKLVPPTCSAQVAVIVFVYVFQCLNVFGYGYYGRDVENRDAILERVELRWLLDKPGKIMVFGDIGSIGTIRFEVYIIFLSVVVLLPIRGGLTLFSIETLKRHPNLSSRTDRLKSKFVRSLIDQLTIVSFFYIYPIAFIFTTMVYQIAFLPQQLLIGVRAVIELLYTINSLMQFIHFMSTNEQYKKILLRILIRRNIASSSKIQIQISPPPTTFA